MKSLSRLLILPLGALLACNYADKKPFGQWPMKAPDGLRQASYSGEPPRSLRLRVSLNGDRWEGALHYRGSSFDSLSTGACNNAALAAVLRQEGDACFSMPLFDEDDSSSDLTGRWVSTDFEEGGRIITEDINFDGHRDLLIYDAQGSTLAQRRYHLWLYEPRSKSYYRWDLAARAGGELLARDRRRRELTVVADSGAATTFKVIGDTTLQAVASSLSSL